MKKTSVYLTEDEHAGLRRLSLSEGRSQAELIREGIQRVIDEADTKPRIFQSMGKGHGGGAPAIRWDPEELYDWVMGKR